MFNATCIYNVMYHTVIYVLYSIFFFPIMTVNIIFVIKFCCRTLAPLVTGGLFTASLSDNAVAIGYPFDYRLVFLVFGSTFLVCVLLVSCLPTSINKQKIIEDLDISIDDS